MTMKVCFVGNSHLGAIYKAWKVLRKQYPWLCIDFFIERSAGTHPLQIVSCLEGGKRAMRLENLLVMKEDPIDVGAYDAFFAFALGLSVIPVMHLYKHYRADAHAWSDQMRLLSDECFHLAAVGQLNESKAMSVARALREHSGKPIHLVAQARPNEHVLDRSEGYLSCYASAVAAGDEAALELTYLHAAGTVCGSVGANLIDQPEETRRSPMLTHGRFGVADPANCGEGSSYAKDDFWHMNDQYGLASLTHVLKHVPNN